MFKPNENQLTLTDSAVDEYISTWLEAFLIDRKAQGLSPQTVKFYQDTLRKFYHYADSQVVTNDRTAKTAL